MFKRHGESWTKDEEEQLHQLMNEGYSFEQIAVVHQRSLGGVTSRARKLGLLDEDGNIVPINKIRIR